MRMGFSREGAVPLTNPIVNYALDSQGGMGFRSCEFIPESEGI